MTEWVYPLGSAKDADWQVSLGAHDSSLAVRGWAHTGIKVAELAPGASVSLDAADEERIIVPLEGAFEVTVDGEPHSLRGRASVFAGPSDVLYTGIGKAAQIRTHDGGRVAVALAPAKASYPTRLIRAEETPIELRGAGNCSRQVHNFGTPDALDAAAIIACEVITPSGNWSSHPAHKHDEDLPGHESRLEEIYYFEAAPHSGLNAPKNADAFGTFAAYSSPAGEIDTSAMVRTGDIALVPFGYHGPAAAAPEYDLYYLNVMAGPGENREWLISDDPRQSWIRKVWQSRLPDPRLAPAQNGAHR